MNLDSGFWREGWGGNSGFLVTVNRVGFGFGSRKVGWWFAW